MHNSDLQHIGASLFQKISSLRNSSIRKAEEGRGAGGDKTHYIDSLAEEVILTGLEALQEPLTIVSEEAGIRHLRGGGGKTVIIDPIDGSRNAVAHAQVSSIKTAGESRTLTGLFWGMANGCAAGCLIGYWVSLGEAGEPWSRVMTGGMLGLLAGGLAGAVIGSVATGGLELISSTERDFTTLKIVTRYPDAEPEFLRAIAP